MLVQWVQLGLSRCAGRATMADWPHGRGGPPLHRGSLGPPQSRLPNGRRAVGESALTERLGTRGETREDR
eukprot:1364966-Alexandrium_andersonii.AAC.1